MLEKQFSNQVERNLKGKKLEGAGKVDKAIKLYEKNIAEEFEGNHPYDRLAIIYRKRKQYEDEIRVLKQAIDVFEKEKHSSERNDIEPKLKKFRDRLIKAEMLNNK